MFDQSCVYNLISMRTRTARFIRIESIDVIYV